MNCWSRGQARMESITRTWRWASAHGNTSVWQLDAIEVTAGGLASVGVEGGGVGEGLGVDTGPGRKAFRTDSVMLSEPPSR